MRAMVLAAGRSERLRPLTETLAKPALPFCGEPVLARVLDGLGAAGVTEAIVNVSHAPDTIRAVVAARGTTPPRVDVSDETALLLGTAGALIPVRRVFAGPEPFLLVNGDCVHAIDHGSLLRDHAASGASATLAVRPTAEAGFGALRVDEAGRVVDFGVRARGAADERHFLSVQAVSPALLAFLPDSPQPFSTFGEWYPAARAAGHVFRVHETTAEWHALDTPDRYLESVRAFLAARGAGPHLDRTASIAPSASIDAGCAVEADCVVGAGATLRGSVLLPGAVVGDGAVVEACVLGPGAAVAPAEHARGEVRVA